MWRGRAGIRRAVSKALKKHGGHLRYLPLERSLEFFLSNHTEEALEKQNMLSLVESSASQPGLLVFCPKYCDIVRTQTQYNTKTQCLS